MHPDCYINAGAEKREIFDIIMHYLAHHRKHHQIEAFARCTISGTSKAQSFLHGSTMTMQRLSCGRQLMGVPGCYVSRPRPPTYPANGCNGGAGRTYIFSDTPTHRHTHYNITETDTHT